MRRLRTAAFALGCSWLAVARAQEAEPPPPEGPDLEFLEYLGSWAEEDDEWLELEQWRGERLKSVGGDFEEAEKESGDEDEGE